MVIIQPTQIVNPQQLMANVAGPDGANTLYVLDGQFNPGIQAYNGQSQEIYQVLLGPKLTRRQFVQAIATASVSSVSSNANSTPFQVNWNVSSIDADWDDESGQVALQVELFVSASANSSTYIASVSYHVTVLAEM